MTFEEYAEKRKAEPILSLLIKNDDDLSKLSTDYGLRIEWIVQCTKDGTKIDRPFLEETFNKLLVEINSYFYESPDIRGFLGGFRAFLLYLPVADREHYDNRLVGFFTDIVASDYDKRIEQTVAFDHIFRFIVFWADWRPQFLVDVQLGVDPQEFGVLSAFLIRRRQDIVKYRDSDYPAMTTIASYMLYMYDLLKDGVDGKRIIDVVKAKDYIQSFMRVVLVSCHNNGYEDQEAQIKQIIARIDSEEDWDKKIMERNSIFISHRSTDAEVADMIKDFLVATGIPNDKVFCSSLPGNDVKFRISAEVKKRLQESIVNILILSKDYYESAYCLNEAGVAWYMEDEADNIAVCLPEINEDKMWGFFNGENKVRRLDNENDVAAIYDAIRKRLNVSSVDFSVVTREKQKLAQRYEQHIRLREKVGAIEPEVEDPDTAEPDHRDTDPFDYPLLQLHASVMLFFAAEDRGEIIVSTTLSGTSYCAGKVCLNESNEPRELAKWEAALEQLLNGGYIKRIGKKDPIYQVTEKGYSISDAFKRDNQFDVDMSPSQISRCSTRSEFDDITYKEHDVRPNSPSAAVN